MTDVLELTDENVELVLDEIRPYLMAGEAPSAQISQCLLPLASGRHEERPALGIPPCMPDGMLSATATIAAWELALCHA